MMFRGSCIVLLLVLASACDGNSRSPSAPSTLSAAPPPADAPFNVSGTIFEYTATGTQPLAGFHFTVTASGTTFSPLTVDVTSDANGRYEATGFPSRAFITVSLAGYRAPCTLDTFRLSGNKILNLNVVSDATLASAGIPESLPTILRPFRARSPAGARRRRTARAVLRPDDLGVRRSREHTVGCAGRYLVCVPPPGGSDQVFSIRARKNGYQPATQWVQIVSNERLNIELRR
jgi:hypothetical protein